MHQRSVEISRVFYAILTMIVVTIGLLSRSSLIPRPTIFSTYGGDVLWALMVYYLIRTFFNQCSNRAAFFAALLFSFIIEFSQLYNAQWINSIRYTQLGGLVLGRGFLTSDLICYSIGVSIGAVGDFLLSAINHREST